MTDVMPEQQAVDLDELVGSEPTGADILDAVNKQLIAQLAGRAREGGLALTGPDGLLKLFTKNVLHTAFNEEMTEHRRHEENQAERDRGSTNVRNGSRSKTLISDAVGEVSVEVPRDRESTSIGCGLSAAGSDDTDAVIDVDRGAVELGCPL